MVAIIILNYNNAHDTIECLKSIKNKSSYKNQHIILVDNGSASVCVQNITDELSKHDIVFSEYDEDFNIVSKAAGNFSLIKIKTNCGYAKGNNLGINFAFFIKATFILILNNDVILTQDVIPHLISFKINHPQAALISPLLYDIAGEIDYNCARKSPSNLQIFIECTSLRKIPFFKNKLNQKYLLTEGFLNNVEVIIDLPSGSCMFCEANLMLKIGGFDENTFLYYEENILYEKIKKLGMQNVLLPQISAIHLGARSTNSVASAIVVDYMFDSVIYYLKKYRSKVIWLRKYLEFRKIVVSKYLNFRASK